MKSFPVRQHWVEACIVFSAFATLPLNGIMALKRLLLLLLVMAAANRIRTSRCLPAIPWPIATWFGLALCSFLWSADPSLTMKEIPPDVIYPFLAFASACILGRDETVYRAGVIGLLAGTFVTVLVGVLTAMKAGGLGHYDWYALAHGYGQFSTVLVLALPFALVIAAETLHHRNPGAFVVVACVIAAIFVGGYATHVRMFWLSAAGVIACVVVLLVRRPEFMHFRKWAAIILGLGMAGMIPLYLAVAKAKPANYLQAQPGAENSVLAAFTQNERFEMWRFWLERVGERPWFGIGFGHSLPMHTYRHLKPGHWFDMMFAHAHNMLLDITVQLGIVGLLAFSAALVALGRHFWRALGAAETGKALAGMAGIALMLAILSKNMTDDYFSRGPLFAFWILAGLVLGRVRGASAR